MGQGIEDWKIWTGLTIASIGIRYALFNTLIALEDAKATKTPVKSVCIVAQDTEDELDMDSLAMLTKHTSYYTRETAIKILTSRLVRRPSILQEIQADAASSDDDTKHKANALLDLLRKTQPHIFTRKRSSRTIVPSIEISGEGEDIRWERETVDFDDSLPTEARPRERGGSPEEQARRRRRREAIVLNEGDRPVSAQDIIQRQRTE